jgi:aminoglycoside/choline kinase family phosphotransferase
MKEELRAFITKTLSARLRDGTFEVLPLAGDASSRRYSRIISGSNSWVLMEWEPYDPDTYSLLSVQRHFKKHAVLVPEVVAFSGELGIILYEDLGDITLEQEFYKTRNPYGVLGYYRMAVDELLKIHLTASKDHSPCVAFDFEFDVEKLSWEMNWTRKHLFEGLLKYGGRSSELEEEFVKLTSILQKQPKCVQHRDYHSRNIMVYQNKVHVIDFQDARLGLVQYDLVSLLRDAYVPMPQSLEMELLEYYLYRAKTDFNREWNRGEFEYLYEVQSIQRLFKAVGSFASFWMLRQDRRYLKYIHGTMQRIKAGIDKLPEFSTLAKALEESGAFEWTEDKL